jgi:hypothetical protein
VVNASYSCNDATSGLDTCAGPVPSGQPIDTSTPGARTFTVTATDMAGNQGSRTVDYTVSSGPTAVRLLAFSATRNGRHTRLRWLTGAESGVLGYAVYRDRGGRRVRATAEGVLARGRLGGAAYSWVDRRRGGAPARYFLQAVKLDGSRAWLASAASG